jgi:hypothetical protein
MKMIQSSELIDYECPYCGYIKKAQRDQDIDCPKCTPDFPGCIKEFINKPEDQKWLDERELIRQKLIDPFRNTGSI